MARWVCPPARWGMFVCESGKTMALWVCPPARCSSDSSCQGVSKEERRKNNGIQGFHENLVTFKRTKLPDFNGLKRCTSKNAVVRYNKKSGKSKLFYTKHESGGKTPRIRPSPSKIGPNPNVLTYSKSP